MGCAVGIYVHICAVIKPMVPIQRRNREKFYFPYKYSTWPVRTAVRVRVFERRTAGHLHQGFPSYSRSSVSLYASHAATPRINFKILAPVQPCQRYENSVPLLFSNLITHPKCSTSLLCCTLPTVDFPKRCLLHYPKLYQPAVVRRTSGYCLGHL